MKLTAPLASFAAAFQTAAAAVPGRTPKPILQNVRLEIVDGAALLQGTSSEISATAVVRDVDGRAGEVALLPAERVGAFLRSLGGETLSIEVCDGKATIRSDDAKFSLATASPDEFPAIERLDDAKHYRVPAVDLAAALRRTAFACDPNAGRFALQCSYLEFGAAEIYVVACDSRRIAWKSLDVENVGEYRPQDSALVPREGARMIQQSLGAVDGEVKLVATFSQLFIGSENLEIAVRLSEGRYPPWRDYMKDRPGASVIEIQAAEFAQALARVKPATDAESLAVDLRFADGRLYLQTESASGGQAEASLAASHHGSPLEAAISHVFLAEYLRAIGDGPLKVEFVNADSHLRFGSEDGHRYVVMPLAKGGE